MSKQTLRVGMIGYAFMGAAHSQGWRNAPRFFDLPSRIELTAVAGRNADAVAAAADQYGFAETETDWRVLLERDDIDLIDICTPGNLHAEIAIAALRAGKHVLCEKPLANTVEEAEGMAAVAREAKAGGVYAMCGFTYRRTPALAYAKQLIDDGRLGTIRHVRGQYLQDWLHDADAPMTWRLDKSTSGSGALGDIGAHLIDTTQWLTGQSISGVSALLETFVTSRPLAGERSGLGGHGDTSEGAPRGAVTVDDAALFTARFDGGAIGSFEASRFALGHKNAFRVEINGTDGSVAFDFEDNNVRPVLRRPRSRRRAGLPADPGHRARAPVRERVVAARSRPGLRARLHPPGGRPGHRPRRGPAADPVLRRRVAGAAGAGRRRDQRRQLLGLDLGLIRPALGQAV